MLSCNKNDQLENLYSSDSKIPFSKSFDGAIDLSFSHEIQNMHHPTQIKTKHGLIKEKSYLLVFT